MESLHGSDVAAGKLKTIVIVTKAKALDETQLMYTQESSAKAPGSQACRLLGISSETMRTSFKSTTFLRNAVAAVSKCDENVWPTHKQTPAWVHSNVIICSAA